MEITGVITAEAAKLMEEVKDYCGSDTVLSVTCTTPAEYMGAGELGKRLAAYKRQLEVERKAAKEPILSAGKDVDNTFAEVQKRVLDALAPISLARREYEVEAEKIRAEEQRKLDEKARIERERLEREAQVQREKEEAAERAAQEARIAAEQEQDAKKKAALEAEARRKEGVAARAAEKAEVGQQIAEQVIAPVVENDAAKTAGVSTRKAWKLKEITDKKAAIEYFLQRGDLEYIDLNTAHLNKLAKMKEEENCVPGVTFHNDAIVAYRG